MSFPMSQDASVYQYTDIQQQQHRVQGLDSQHTDPTPLSKIQKTAPIVQDTLLQASSPSGSIYSAITADESEKSFVCPHCDHVFSRKHNLKSHLLIHSKEKPFNCSICSSKFRRLHDLKRHEKLHTGEKPHQCKNCGRKFARLDALVRHNNSQTGCTLLIDNSVIKETLLSGTSTFNTDRRRSSVDRLIESNTEGAEQPPLLPTIISQSSQFQTLSKPSGSQPSQSVHESSQQINNETSQPSSQQQKAFESQWRVNQLPSINNLTPSLPPVSSPTSQPGLSHHLSFDSSASDNNNTKVDLLSYVKLLESRVSLLESKLNATDTKVVQMSYSLQQAELTSKVHDKK